PKAMHCLPWARRCRRRPVYHLSCRFGPPLLTSSRRKPAAQSGAASTLPIFPGHHIGAAAVEPRGPGGLDDDRGRHLLDDRRPLYRRASAKGSPVIDRGADARPRRAEHRSSMRLDRLAGSPTLSQRRGLGLIDQAVKRRFDVDDLHGRMALRIGVKLLMAAMERVLHAIDRLLVDLERVDIDRALVHLPYIAHFEAALGDNVLLGESVVTEMPDALGLDLVKKPIETGIGL